MSTFIFHSLVHFIAFPVCMHMGLTQTFFLQLLTMHIRNNMQFNVKSTEVLQYLITMTGTFYYKYI